MDFTTSSASMSSQPTALPTKDVLELLQLLYALQSPDNDTRTRAESSLIANWFKLRPADMFMGLSELMNHCADRAIRCFCAVLFRRFASKSFPLDESANNGPANGGSDTPSAAAATTTTNNGLNVNVSTSSGGVTKEVFFCLGEAQRRAIETQLLSALQNAPDSKVSRKISDAIAEVARQHGEYGSNWSELLSALFQASRSNDPVKRESAFCIFSASPKIIERQHENAVLEAFSHALSDEVVGVRLAALEAFSSFIRSIRRKSRSKYFGLLPDLLNILPPLKDSCESEQLSTAFISLIDLAEVVPKMFTSLFSNLLTFCVSIIQDKQLDDRTRQNAMELMTTFVESAPQMCKRDENYTQEMVTQCLSFMTDLAPDDDDAREWNAVDDLDSEDSDANHVAGEQCMDRLASRLGGEVVLPPTFNWLPRMMSSSAWRDRHASLMTISAICEGCRDLMVDELDKVLQLVLPALQDPHPRVRWAACNALGQMSTDFAGTIQTKYHHIILPALIPILQAEEPRIQAHAAAALVNFSEDAEKSILSPYLDSLISQLLNLLRSPKKYVQEQALSTIATVADSAELAFTKYYSMLMPLLINVLENEVNPECRGIRAKAMECATLIALAVQKERLGSDIEVIFRILCSTQSSVNEPDDPQLIYLLHSWARMCRILGKEFLPYMCYAMPPLFEMASSGASIQYFEDKDEINGLDQEDGWDFMPLKGQYIGINTSALDDKCVAIELLVVYAQTLDEDFAPYVEEILKCIVLPGLSMYISEPVRTSSARCLPYLLNSYRKAYFNAGDESRTKVYRIWDSILGSLFEALLSEPAIDTLALMFQCFYECLELMGKDCLNDEQMNRFIDTVKFVLDLYLKRFDERQKEMEDLDELDDNTEYQHDIEDDHALLSDMNKAFHIIFKNMGNRFLPYWERLIPIYDQFAKAPGEPTQRQWSVCLYDDVLEFCPDKAIDYHRYIIPAIISGLRDTDAGNRQAAAYGVGMASLLNGVIWQDFVAGCLQDLFLICQHSQARHEEHVYATENACASIAKILKFNGSKLPDPQRVVDEWLTTLPILHDDEAAPYAYTFLADLIESHNQSVWSSQRALQCFMWVVQALHEQSLPTLSASTKSPNDNNRNEVDDVDMNGLEDVSTLNSVKWAGVTTDNATTVSKSSLESNHNTIKSTAFEKNQTVTRRVVQAVRTLLSEMGVSIDELFNTLHDDMKHSVQAYFYEC